MEVKRRSAIFYKDIRGKEPAKDWLEKLRDTQGKAAIFTRINRALEGNFGDHKSIGDGINELRISFGPGYRIYYAITDNDDVVLLLVGGDKSTQTSDIKKAKQYWKSHKGS
jgi:putative addiction module killer protein